MANVPEPGKPLRVVLAPSAQRDIREALKWTRREFGDRAEARYRGLLKQALRDVAGDAERPGSRARPELAQGVRTYHLFFSRERVKSGVAVVKEPRHFLVYRRCGERIEVARVLHDARELERHLPGDYLRDAGKAAGDKE